MRKFNKTAFTLIELIIVITIIVISSSTGIFYFYDFIWKQELKQELFTIKKTIKSLDQKIKDYEIFDYEININTSTWSLGYIYYTNTFDTQNQQIIDFNSTSGSGSIYISWFPESLWNIKIFNNDKMVSNQVRKWDKNYIYNFIWNSNYNIKSYLSWEILNDIHISYFNQLNSKENIQLVWINSQNDQNWIEYNNLKISNIWWKKEIFWESTSINEIYLFFENKWVESFIQIIK